MTNPSRISTFIGVAVLAAAAIPATGLASGQAANQSRCTASTAGAAIGDSVLWMAADNYGQKRALQRALLAVVVGGHPQHGIADGGTGGGRRATGLVGGLPRGEPRGRDGGGREDGHADEGGDA